MYTAGQVYWAYIGKAKTRVLVLEPYGKRLSDSYKVLKLCQASYTFTLKRPINIGSLNGSAIEYNVDLASPCVVCNNAFVSYIDNLSPEIFTNIYGGYYKLQAEKKAKRKKQDSSNLLLAVGRKKYTPKKVRYSAKFKLARRLGGYARQTWLPPGNTRIKVYHG